MKRMFSPFNTFAVVGAGEESQARNVTELFDKIEIEFMESQFSELATILVFAKCVAHIHQTHHWQARGQDFFGDHLMFERVYTSVSEHVDAIAEKTVGAGGAALVEMTRITRMVATVTEWMKAIYCSETSVIPSDTDLVRLSLAAEECLVGATNYAIMKMESAGTLSKGIDNMLSQLVDDREGASYLLRRASIC